MKWATDSYGCSCLPSSGWTYSTINSQAMDSRAILGSVHPFNIFISMCPGPECRRTHWNPFRRWHPVIQDGQLRHALHRQNGPCRRCTARSAQPAAVLGNMASHHTWRQPTHACLHSAKCQPTDVAKDGSQSIKWLGRGRVGVRVLFLIAEWIRGVTMAVDMNPNFCRAFLLLLWSNISKHGVKNPWTSWKSSLVRGRWWEAF